MSQAFNIAPTAPNSPSPAALSYRVPPPVPLSLLGHRTPSNQERDLIQWVNAREREMMSYLAAQPAWSDIQRSRDILFNQAPYFTHPRLSKTQINQAKHDVSEMVATYADLRFTADYSTRNREYEDTKDVLNSLYVDLMLDTDLDRTIKQVLQEASCSTGYLSPVWRKPYMNIGGEPGIEFDVFPADKVGPIQPGDDAKVQTSYGIHAIKETPIARAHAMYPEYQDKIFADRETPTFMRRVIKRARRAGSMVLAFFGRDGRVVDGTSTYPTVDIRHTYVKDMSVNTTGKEVVMGGVPGTHSWAYRVPSLTTNGEITKLPKRYRVVNGVQEVAEWRDITREECLLYPRGRYIVSTRTCILHDGPNPYWHGRFPFIPFKLDPWPGLWLGFGLVPQVADIYEAANKLVRQIEDSGNARLNPPYSYDEDVVTDAMASKIIPRMPGQRWKENRRLGEGIKFPFPFEYYNVPPFVPEFVQFLYSKGRELLGLADVQAFARARQMPAADTTEKLLEMIGPLVKDRAREIESSIKELGYQVMSHFFQFYTIGRRIRILGVDGVTPQDLDFDPGSLLPGIVTPEERFQAAQKFMMNFTFNVTPGSLHNITSMTRNMLLLQLHRAGVLPLDRWTAAEMFGVGNYGMPPEGATTVTERMKAQQLQDIEFAAKLREAVQPQNPLEGLPAEIQTMIMNLLGARGNGGGGGQGGSGGAQVGRPPSGASPPQIVQKDGGMRSTISESGR